MDMQDITNIQANTDLTKSEANQKNELEIKFKKMKEKEDFYQRLIEFHRHKNVNTPIINFPTLNGKLIDLQKLYNIVISLGGWEKVCEKDKWSEVGLNLDAKLFKSCLNGAHAIKTIYIRYLSLYEKFDFQLSYGNSLNQGASLSSLLDPLHNFNNPSLPHSMTVSVINPITNLSNLDRSSLGYHKNSAPNLEDNLDTDINRKKFSYLLDSTPMNYTYSQHILNNTNTSHLNPNPYEKLEISLLCGLPNEVDFVFNTMILLSSEENNTFKIYQSPRLISLMLAHVGFFGDNDKYNLKNLYDKYWFKQVEKEDDKLSKEKLFEKYLEKDDLNLLNEQYEKASQSMCSRNFPKFWTHIVNIPDEDFGQKILLNEIIPNENEKFKTNLEGLNLTEIRSDLNETILPYTIEYKRIEQVLIILNNLSFEDLNADFMANKCQVLFEFLIMCLYSNHPIYDIKKHALDIWANISRKLKLNLLSEKNSKLFLNALYHVLIGQEEIQYLTIEENDANEELVTKMVPVLDRLGLIRGLEILTKLCTQEQLDTLHDDESINNEKIISKFSVDYKNGKTMLLLERVFKRLDEILPVQDVLILLHSLEFMYNITQFNQFICNLIFDSCSSMNETGEQLQCKLIQVLINFLSIDMSHFGVTNNDASNQIKMYKIVPSNGQIVAIAPSTQTPANSVSQSNLNSSAPIAQNAQKNNSLLQQTLNNQHQTTTKPQSVNAQIKIPSSTNNDQHAKNILSNWLITCFQTDSNSELSKTQLYPYYQQISKYNNWPVLTIPTFFEILNSTFPHLRYDEDSNKIHGLKLILNLKQQLELKQKFANISSTPVHIPTQSAPAQQLQFTLKPDENNKSSICPLSPPPSMSINIPISSMNAPLMTPPPPIEMPLRKSENEQQETKNVLINGENKTNFVFSQSKESMNNEGSEMISQNEDSLMSNSSSSTNAVSASNSTTSAKLDEKSNKENDFNLKRKNEIINDNLTEPKQQISKILNESTQESSPVKKKKLKINEMEDFMNKPMAPITIVSNQFSNTIQIQFKTDQIPQPILIANSTTPSIKTQSIQAVVQQLTNQHNIVQQQVQQIPQNVQVVQISQTDNQTFAQQQHHQQIQQQINNGNYLCEWNNCNSFFASAKAVYNHVCKYHLFNTSFSSDSEGQLCLWSGCDQVKRQKWSLVNHIQERHCNENTMKHATMCRQQGIIKSVNNQNLTNSHLNYSKDAAFFAIQRHHRLKKEDFLSPPEGPITKSIRLLSALTLRNMARNSEKAKKIIQNYESQLACIAFDLLESSNAISSCLWHLSH
ncbi:unnamed protein product [Brachionus calyciflorus]|uniref:ARID domain-containing protein n=1 Tax=Brachionus calyciflorus TaxID=104777 RepID=A0A814F094_9BILA|nr:unnamed protein product [Brachionus calyciflorus]